MGAGAVAEDGVLGRLPGQTQSKGKGSPGLQGSGERGRLSTQAGRVLISNRRILKKREQLDLGQP